VKTPRLREWREAMGETQVTLADKSGVAEHTISRIEHGASLRPTTARKLADALGVAVADLMESPPVLALAGKAKAPDTGSSVDSTEEVITFDDEAVRAAISAAKAGKLTTKEAAQAIADSVRGGPADALEDAVELLLEQAEREHSEDREGAKT
jgi:transcriptional regulator with XRE-family HTH domain